MVYTTRLAGGIGGRNAFESELRRNTFESELRRLHVVQKNSRPSHPDHLREGGEISADHEEVAPRHPVQPATITELQALIDAFVDEY